MSLDTYRSANWEALKNSDYTVKYEARSNYDTRTEFFDATILKIQQNLIDNLQMIEFHPTLQEVTLLAGVLKENSSIKKLHIEDGEFSSESIKILFIAINSSRLHTLFLNINFDQANCGNELCALLKNSSLKVVSIKDYKDWGIERTNVARAVEGSALSQLDCSNFCLGEEEKIRIQESLKNKREFVFHHLRLLTPASVIKTKNFLNKFLQL